MEPEIIERWTIERGPLERFEAWSPSRRARLSVHEVSGDVEYSLEESRGDNYYLFPVAVIARLLELRAAAIKEMEASNGND